MCGRYASSASVEEIIEEFRVNVVGEEVPREPRYNIAPTQPVRTVVERVTPTGELERRLAAPRWGLVPSWSKGPGTGPLMINARVETVAQKPSFRAAFAKRRCLLPADGYYEWQRLEGGPARRPAKQPWFIRPSTRETFAMAGVYEFWKGADDDWLVSVAIITTTATDDVGHVHDRMPMTVRDVDAWLDPALTSPHDAHDLLVAPEDMHSFRVSPAVGNVANDDATLVVPLAEGTDG